MEGDCFEKHLLPPVESGARELTDRDPFDRRAVQPRR
jgi:hypothetical protein